MRQDGSFRDIVYIQEPPRPARDGQAGVVFRAPAGCMGAAQVSGNRIESLASDSPGQTTYPD